MTPAQTAIFQSIQTNLQAIDNAAGDFLPKLTGTDINKDISLAAQMAGVMLLRNGSVDLSKLPAGVAVLGAVSDEAMETIQRYVAAWAKMNGLDFGEADLSHLSKEQMQYFPEVTNYEAAFRAVCAEHAIAAELLTFVAATAAMKLVIAGDKLKLLPAPAGMAMAAYHVIAGAKTVPHAPGSVVR